MPTQIPPAESSALLNTSRLVAALDDPQAFGHPLQHLKLLETHISWVILTGEYAYKIKKPVDFGFLDFSSLRKRRHYCEEELRLNRRFAPQIYLGLVEIRGTADAPRLHGHGEVIEYAVKMLEFPQRDLLSALAQDERLENRHIDLMADTISAAHAGSPRCDPGSDFGSARSVARWSDENIDHINASVPQALLPRAFHRLETWYRHDDELAASIDARKQAGFVRECHGDCHLGNMALIEDRVVLFDCIEFNPELRWIDTISEAAFVAMDLQARGYAGFCWRFVNRYLEAGGDYEGIRLLRYYFVYRALVRAKVEALRVDQNRLDETSLRPAFDYILLAERWAGSHRAALILMHGLSGSGKSTVAAQLAEKLGAIRIRSDVERKRLFGLGADAHSGSTTGGGIYAADASEQTYRRLAELAQIVVDSDFCVIVDATFLRRSQRLRILGLKSRHAHRNIIVDCDAPRAELERRIATRADDPSEADLSVLERQIAIQEPLAADELENAALISVGAEGLGEEQLQAIGKLIEACSPTRLT